MAPRKLTQIERWIGTEAERLALDASGFSPGSTFFERDTGSMHKWDGTSWGKEIITVADNGQIKGYDGTDWQPVRVNDEGNLKVSLSGNIATLYSMNFADRPLYTEITEPTIFVLMNSAMDMWWTDGSADWVVI